MLLWDNVRDAYKIQFIYLNIIITISLEHLILHRPKLANK